jgi:N-acetylglucosamine kinase-like BadF-type ATPase
MIFIIESGSTKSDWVLIDDKNNQSFYKTIGFNPYFHSAQNIASEIRQNEKLISLSDKIEGIYFYGAGCSSKELNKIVEKGLSSIFSTAKITVEHDLLACAYATYDGAPGISCILGTGSNSCYFDGKSLVEEVPALGYVLGDEGSGSYFGKFLLSNYLYKKLPKEINDEFEKRFKVTNGTIVDKVYKQANPNVYIASFMPFIIEHKNHPFFNPFIIKGLKHFLEVHVCCYDNYEKTSIHFVGSLSALLENELNAAAQELGISIKSIVQKPVGPLVDYHINYILKDQLVD